MVQQLLGPVLHQLGPAVVAACSVAVGAQTDKDKAAVLVGFRSLLSNLVSADSRLRLRSLPAAFQQQPAAAALSLQAALRTADEVTAARLWSRISSCCKELLLGSPGIRLERAGDTAADQCSMCSSFWGCC
uniref:Uncharacterized protein n=1 Tax=Tetradesmus obliquus TaxID=3088 RepID=A0A383W106_TETOB|eukprot:jgi/Sobl393_1/16449/SZX71181.1